MGFELVDVDAQGAARSEVIEWHRTEVNFVILGVGDGTLNAAVDGLLQTGLPLGIIPLGTANKSAPLCLLQGIVIKRQGTRLTGFRS